MKDIELLIELQAIDSNIFKTKEKLREKPVKIAELDAKFSDLCSGLKKMEENLKQAQLQLKEKELELQTKEQTVSKQQSQLFQVKSNKEYNVLQLEIEKNKADNSLLEEQILVLLEKVDFFKKTIAAEKGKLSFEEKKIIQEKTLIETDIKELNGQMDALNARRNCIINSRKVRVEILTLYERILENRGEIALVPVKDNACGGCYMSMRPQVVNELRMGKLLTCDNCSRILYVEAENE
ncbi:MAG: hypothetical protein HY810_01885 [Candidatus Omnitrophica bacterium]|nr:hypothetical protein [Candidatus Omnitrophota bacterium]